MRRRSVAWGRMQAVVRAWTLGLVVLGLVWSAAPAPAAGFAPVSPLTVGSPVLVDSLSPPSAGGVGWDFASVSCPTTTLCIAGGTGEIASSSDPGGGPQAWSVVSVDVGRTLVAMSCPSTNLCVALDNDGQVLVSTDPAGPASAWTVTDSLGGSATGLSCPSVSLCVAVGYNAVFTSTDPTSTVQDWTVTYLPVAGPYALRDVSCPTVSLCIAVADGVVYPQDDASGVDVGEVWTSTAPTGGAGAWSVGVVGSGFAPASVSCPSSWFCAAAGLAGDIATTTDPAAGAGSWTDAPVVKTTNQPIPYPRGCDHYQQCPVAPSVFGAIGCVSATLCVATGFASSGAYFYYVSTSPAAGVWTSGPPVGTAANGVSCPSTALCALASPGGIDVSTAPLSGPSVGGGLVDDSAAGLVPGAPCLAATPCANAAITGASCASLATCVAVDGDGNVATSTAATTPGAAWSVTHIDAQWSGLTSVSCATVSFCAAVDSSGNVLISSNPTVPGSWQILHVSGAELTAVSCPTTSLCIAAGNDGSLLTSTEPDLASGTGTWRIGQLVDSQTALNDSVNAIDCPSAQLCLATTPAGDVYTSTDPAAGAGAWREITIAADGGSDPDGVLHGLTCASDRFCAAFDTNGAILISRDPGAAEPVWTPHAITQNGYRGAADISCPTPTLCALVDDSPNILVSGSPGAGNNAWVSTTTTSDLTRLVCPSATACLIFDSAGDVRLDTTTPPPTRAAIAAQLKPQTTPKGQTAELRQITAVRGYAFEFVSLARGTLRVSWYMHKALIGRATKMFVTSETEPVTLKLTRQGRARLRHLQRLAIRVIASFTQPRKKPITTTIRVTLHR